MTETVIKPNKITAFFFVLALASGSSVTYCLAESATKVEKSEVREPEYNRHALHRLDFRVVGKSCALCLHRMQDRMKELPGIVKVGVMLKKPYGAVVIYDSSKVRADKIFEKAREGVPEVSFEDKIDAPIKTVPLVLIPAAAAAGEDKAITDLNP